jgi:hypothetical protein
MQTTNSIWAALDDNLPLELFSINGEANSITIDMSEDTDDGIYPTAASWKRVLTGMDKEGTSYWVNRLTRKKDKCRINLEDYTITRDQPWHESAVIEFARPIQVVLNRIGDKTYTAPVKKIRGRFNHEYWFSRNSEMATRFDIYFVVEQYME